MHLPMNMYTCAGHDIAPVAGTAINTNKQTLVLTGIPHVLSAHTHTYIYACLELQLGESYLNLFICIMFCI